jgi:hypothetical protein
MPRWPSTKIVGNSVQYSLIVSAQNKGMIKSLEFSQPTTSYWPKPFTPYTYWHHQYYGGWISLRPSLDFPDLAIFTQTPENIDLTESTWIDQLGNKLTLWSQLHLSWWPKILILSLVISSIWGGWLNWLSVTGLAIIGVQQAILKTRLNTWQIALPETSQKDGWFVLTTQSNPAKAWWAKAVLSENQRQLYLNCQIPKAIQNLRVTPVTTTTKAPRSPVSWETDFLHQLEAPMPTFNIECKPKNLSSFSN